MVTCRERGIRHRKYLCQIYVSDIKDKSAVTDIFCFRFGVSVTSVTVSYISAA